MRRVLGATLGITLILCAILLASGVFQAPARHDDDGVFFPPSQHVTVSPKLTAPVPKADEPVHTSFREKANAILGGLPRRSDLRPSTKQGGSTSAGLLAASSGLGAISQSLRADTSLIADGLDFYRACVASDDILVAVRAVCLKNLRYWTSRSRSTANTEEGSYPEQIKELADRLSELH